MRLLHSPPELLSSSLHGSTSPAAAVARRLSDCFVLADSGAAKRLLASLARKSNPAGDLSLRLLVDMARRGFPPSNTVHFTALLDKLCRSGRTDEAWDLLHSMKLAGAAIRAPFCNALLTGLAKKRDFGRIKALFLEMEAIGVRPTVVTYGILVNHLCKSRRVQEALQVLDEMTSRDSEAPRPNGIIFNTLVDGLCKSGRTEDGLALLRRMTAEHGCAADVVTYNSLIDGFCKTGEVDKAHGLTEEMEREGVPINVVTVNTIVAGMCRSGRVIAALSFFRRNQSSWEGRRGSSEPAYSSLIGALLHSHNVGKAKELFDEMPEEGCSPNIVTYFTLISGLTKSGQFDDALGVISLMRKKGMRLDLKCCNLLIRGFCRKKRLASAREVFDEMSKDGLRPNSTTFKTLISASCNAGDIVAARCWLQKMVDHGFRPSMSAYTALIRGYCRTDQVEEAMELRRRMVAFGIEPNTAMYNVLMQSLSKKDPDAAMALMREMKMKGLPVSAMTYNAMFVGLKDRNMLDEAMELMGRMKEENCDPDYLTVVILTEWLSSVGHAERLKGFVTFVRQISSIS